MKAIILAAGKGSRLASEAVDLPKALRLVNGKPLIQHVLGHLDFLKREDITIVVGIMKEKVIKACGPLYSYVEQQNLLGTAKATLCAEPRLAGYEGPVLVGYCDMPLLRRETYRAMFDAHIRSGAGATLLAGKTHPIPPYGRLIRDVSGRLCDVVEDSACTDEQKMIDEVNVGIQVFDAARMWAWLRGVTNDNPKGEYYLTGAVRVLAREGIPQEIVTLEDPTEMLGVNTMEDLAFVEKIIKMRAE